MSKTCKVTLDDSRAFAALSGDFNPQHLDPVRARRLLFGSSVVHGLHLVLLALDAALAGGVEKGFLQSLRVVFSGPTATGSSVSFVHENTSSAVCTIFVKSGDRTIVTIDAVWAAEWPNAKRVSIGDELFVAAEPTKRVIEDIKSHVAQVPLKVERMTLHRLFPNVAAKLPIEQVAILLATTRIVGMDCPGRDSIFAGLDVAFDPFQDDDLPVLDVRVTQIRHVLRVCSMAISGINSNT